jgi:hypothetical protein
MEIVMNIALWVLQILLAVHTLMGVGWKLINPPQAVDSLAAIPHFVWIGISVIEVFFSVGLALPALHRPLAILAPISAAGIAAIMLIYSAIHLASGKGDNGQLIYWLVVAAIAAFIVYGRLALKPL